MVATDDAWRQACVQARGFLRRYSDAWTREHRDDVVQEAALAAWRWSQNGGVTRVGAAMRTIARRVRCRALLGTRRLLIAQAALSRTTATRCDDEPRFRVAGARVPFSWLVPHLRRALGGLSALDRQLLLSFHEGFCCAELALRFDSTEQRIKTRIHRARRRIRSELEARVRVADDLETWSTNDNKQER